MKKKTKLYSNIWTKRPETQQMKISKSRYKWFAYLSTFIQIKMYEVEQKQKDADMEPTICFKMRRMSGSFLLIEGNFMFENHVVVVEFVGLVYSISLL